jgi:hypothetical protein
MARLLRARSPSAARVMQAVLFSIVLECTTPFTVRSVPNGAPCSMSLSVTSGSWSMAVVCNSCFRKLPITRAIRPSGRHHQLHQSHDPSWFRDNVGYFSHDGSQGFSDVGGFLEINGSGELRDSVAQHQYPEQSPEITTPAQPSKSPAILGPAAIRSSLLQALQLDSNNPSDLELLDRLLTTLEIEDLASFLPPNTPMASLKMVVHLAHAKRAAAERSHELQLAQARSITSEPPHAQGRQTPRPDFSALLPASTLEYDGTAMGQGPMRRVVSTAEYLARFQESCQQVGCVSSADQGRELLRLLSGPADAYIRQELPMDPSYGPDWRGKVAEEKGNRGGERLGREARQREEQGGTAETVCTDAGAEKTGQCPRFGADSFLILEQIRQDSRYRVQAEARTRMQEQELTAADSSRQQQTAADTGSVECEWQGWLGRGSELDIGRGKA